MKPFESILAKARKLAALADPNNGGSAGEIQNAREMLRVLLERHNITAAMLDVSERRLQLLACSPLNRLVKHKQMVSLAVQCLALVTGERTVSLKAFLREVEVSNGKRKTVRKIYFCAAKVTTLEYDEWRECFYHYASDFASTLTDLDRQAKTANKAVAMALQGFANKHHIFPASDGPAKQPTPAEMAALIKAMEASHGQRWQRKAGHLDNGGFYLTA